MEDFFREQGWSRSGSLRTALTSLDRFNLNASGDPGIGCEAGGDVGWGRDLE